MTITQTKVIDQITADEHGNIMYRETTRIMEDEVQLSQTYHRGSYSPGADLTNADPKVALIAQATWTPETIAPFTAQVTSAISTNRGARETLEIETANYEAAKAASEAAQAQAKTAADALEAENKRLADALAVQAAAEQTAKDKAAFDAAVAAKVAEIAS